MAHCPHGTLEVRDKINAQRRDLPWVLVLPVQLLAAKRSTPCELDREQCKLRQSDRQPLG